MTPYESYRQLLTRWNRAIRLVGSDADFDRHVAESRALLPFVPEVGRLVDVGAGGGFPAVVIAIERPGVHVVALEPIHKKHAFLAAVQRELGLANFEPRAERDDQHAPPALYDAATSRATFAVSEWLERGLALVRPGGVVLAMEGRQQAELPAGAVRHPVDADGRRQAIVVRTVA